MHFQTETTSVQGDDNMQPPITREPSTNVDPEADKEGAPDKQPDEVISQGESEVYTQQDPPFSDSQPSGSGYSRSHVDTRDASFQVGGGSVTGDDLPLTAAVSVSLPDDWAGC